MVVFEVEKKRDWVKETREIKKKKYVSVVWGILIGRLTTQMTNQSVNSPLRVEVYELPLLK